MTAAVRHRRCRRGRAVVHRAAGSPVPGSLDAGLRSAQSLTKGARHGPLQEQRARSRVQPVRGARAGEGAGQPASSATSTASRCARCSKRRRGWPKGRWRNPSPTPTVNPPTFDPETHAVSLPESFKKSFRAWQQGEWFRIGLDEDVGGVPAPAMVAWAINEFPLGAQPAAFMYMAGPVHGEHPVPHRQRATAALGGAGRRAQLGRHHGAHRTRRRIRRRRRAARRRSSSPTAPGTSTASSGSSPTATPTTCSRTSCTWCWPGPRAPDRAPRA